MFGREKERNRRERANEDGGELAGFLAVELGSISMRLTGLA